MNHLVQRGTGFCLSDRQASGPALRRAVRQTADRPALADQAVPGSKGGRHCYRPEDSDQAEESGPAVAGILATHALAGCSRGYDRTHQLLDGRARFSLILAFLVCLWLRPSI